MAKKKNKKITLNEFRAWLDGVEELQPNDWSPDAKQWKLIRDKIDNIIENQPAPVAEAPAQGTYNVPTPAPAPTHMVEAPAPTGPVVAPPPPGAVPSSALDAVVEVSPAARAAMSGKLPTNASSAPPALSAGPDGKIRTPNVDTSDGTYNSALE